MTEDKKLKFKIQIPKWLIEVSVLIIYVAMCIYSMYISLTCYRRSEYFAADNVNFWEIVISELGNAFTICTAIICIVTPFLIKKLGTRHAKVITFVSPLIFGFYIFNRCAVIMNLSLNMFSVIVAGVYAITILVIILCSEKPSIEGFKSTNLEKIIGKIKNSNILSVQLFSVKKDDQGDFVDYEFKYIDSVMQEGFDVNGMLSTTYRLESSDVEGLNLAIAVYDKLVELGTEEQKKRLLEIIENNKNNLITQLKTIKSVDEVGKDDCCKARLVILYLTLANMLKDTSSPGIIITDGILELQDCEIEKKLFTLVRTGILGTIFWGNNEMYTFHYNKDGAKSGRKYCAFSIPTSNKEPKLVCLIIVKESKNSYLSRDIITAIQKIEKTIVKKIKLEEI